MKMLLQSLRRGFEQENHLSALFMSAMFVDSLKMWLILICKWLSVDAVQKLTTEDVYLGGLLLETMKAASKELGKVSM